MKTVDRGREPLMRTCSSTQTLAGHCGLESYEAGTAPLCYYHRKTAGMRLVGGGATLGLVGR